MNVIFTTERLCYNLWCSGSSCLCSLVNLQFKWTSQWSRSHRKLHQHVSKGTTFTLKANSLCSTVESISDYKGQMENRTSRWNVRLVHCQAYSAVVIIKTEKARTENDHLSLYFWTQTRTWTKTKPKSSTMRICSLCWHSLTHKQTHLWTKACVSCLAC